MMSTIGKVCAQCCVELRPETNGVLVVLYASFGPYQAYHADLWRCPTCSNDVLLGFGQPIAEHFSHDLTDMMTQARGQGEPVFRFWENERQRAKDGDPC